MSTLSTADRAVVYAACPLDQLLVPDATPEPGMHVFCLDVHDIDSDVLFEIERLHGQGVIAWPERLRIRIHPRALHLWDNASTLCIFRMSSRDPGFYAICAYLWLLLRAMTTAVAPRTALAAP